MYRERLQNRDVASSHSMQRWSPAQMLGMAIAIFLLVLGGVVLNNTGLELPGKNVVIAGLHHNALLGLLEVVFALILLAFAAMPGGDKMGLTIMGLLLAAGGLMILIDPDSFYKSLGTHDGNGILFLIMGILLAGLAFFAPTFTRSRRSISSDEMADSAGDQVVRTQSVAQQPVVQQPVVQQPVVEQSVVREEYVDEDPLL